MGINVVRVRRLPTDWFKFTADATNDVAIPILIVRINFEFLSRLFI